MSDKSLATVNVQTGEVAPAQAYTPEQLQLIKGDIARQKAWLHNEDPEPDLAPAAHLSIPKQVLPVAMFKAGCFPVVLALGLTP